MRKSKVKSTKKVSIILTFVLFVITTLAVSGFIYYRHLSHQEKIQEFSNCIDSHGRVRGNDLPRQCLDNDTHAVLIDPEYKLDKSIKNLDECLSKFGVTREEPTPLCETDDGRFFNVVSKNAAVSSFDECVEIYGTHTVNSKVCLTDKYEVFVDDLTHINSYDKCMSETNYATSDSSSMCRPGDGRVYYAGQFHNEASLGQDEYAKGVGLTLEELKKRNAISERYGQQLEKGVRAILPADRFAGEWPNDKRIREIHIVGGLPKNDPYYRPIHSLIKDLGIGEYVEIKSAKYSQQEIILASNWLSNNWPEGDAVIGGGGLGAYNYTEVSLRSPEIALSQEEIRFIDHIKTKYGDLVRFEYVSVVPVLELL